MTVNVSTLQDAKSWRSHRNRWGDCILCPLGLARTCSVLGRGWLPCDILFIGEAPGPSEDASGQPFVGRAGKILKTLLADVRSHVGQFRYFITNTLACYPDDGTGHFRPPAASELNHCFPRVANVVQMADPRGIVYLGKVAESLDKRLISQYPTLPSRIYVYHPSYLARKGGPRSLEGKKTVHKLTQFIRQCLTGTAPNHEPMPRMSEIPF